jgi:hypothetical protein
MAILIISGGQTGADIAGLMAAKEVGFNTSGFAPKGYKTELGSNLLLKTHYHLKETSSSGYAIRTRMNANWADISILFSDDSQSKGTLFTISCCKKANNPYLLLSSFDTNAVQSILAFIKPYIGFNKHCTINIAGNRASKAPGIQDRVFSILVDVFKEIKLLCQ